MPFKSQAQRRALYAKDPKVAREFEAATPKGKKLPERMGDMAAPKKPYGPDESPNLGGRNLKSARYPTGTAKGGKAYGNARADVTKPTKAKPKPAPKGSGGRARRP